MRTTLSIDFDGPPSSNNYSRGFARKSIDLPFAPPVGMEIEDTAWKEGRKVQRVTLIIEEREATLFVNLGTLSSDSKEKFEKTLEMYKLHGWEVKGSR